MSHSNKERLSSSSSRRWYDQYSTSGGCRSGVVHRTTNLSPHEVYLSTYRYGGGVLPSHINCTAPPMVSYYSRYYSVGASSDSSFGVSGGYGKGGVGPRTTHFSSQKVGFWIDGVDFVSYWSRDYSSMIGGSLRLDTYPNPAKYIKKNPDAPFVFS